MPLHFLDGRPPSHHGPFRGRGNCCCALLLAVGWLAMFGCVGPFSTVSGPKTPAIIENPLFVPVADPDFAWSQLVDTVDDYFRIEREQRSRVEGGTVTEGRIDTFPRIGSTLLEPWRKDSAPGYERWHATLQSIRRRATVRIVPVERGMLVEVAVYKEVEDVNHPEESSATSIDLRHDNSLERGEAKTGLRTLTLGWISVGRDTALEQRMLAEIEGRLKEGGRPVTAVAPR